MYYYYHCTINVTFIDWICISSLKPQFMYFMYMLFNTYSGAKFQIHYYNLPSFITHSTASTFLVSAEEVESQLQQQSYGPSTQDLTISVSL